MAYSLSLADYFQANAFSREQARILLAILALIQAEIIAETQDANDFAEGLMLGGM